MQALGRGAARLGYVGLAVASVLTACTAAPGSRPSPPAAQTSPAALTSPAARPVDPDPRVGAVYLGDGDLHTCTASVLAPSSANLILTAGHCLARGVEARFVPGDGDDDGDGVVEAGSWAVDAVYLDPRWVTGTDPAADFAVAHVSRSDGAGLQSVVGDGLRLATSPRPGAEVTVIGYPAGVGGGPAACRASTAPALRGFPTLHCAGIVGGFSGAPWITGSSVSGLVGGLDGGGCAEEVSYSPPFDDAVARLQARAQAGGPGDDPPPFFDDGCG